MYLYIILFTLIVVSYVFCFYFQWEIGKSPKDKMWSKSLGNLSLIVLMPAILLFIGVLIGMNGETTMDGNPVPTDFDTSLTFFIYLMYLFYAVIIILPIKVVLLSIVHYLSRLSTKRRNSIKVESKDEKVIE